MSVQLFIVCLYIAMLFGISFWVKRRADKGSTEYLFAGRKLGTGLIAVNITGLAVGASPISCPSEKIRTVIFCFRLTLL